MSPPEIFLPLDALDRTQHGLRIPRWVPNVEALYLFLYFGDDILNLLTVRGAGLLRVGSSLKPRQRIQEGANAARMAFEVGGPHSPTNMHSLVRWQVETGAQIRLSEIGLLIVYTECACQVEQAARAANVQFTGQNPPGNPTPVSCPRGRYWRKQCNGRVGEELWQSLLPSPSGRFGSDGAV